MIHIIAEAGTNHNADLQKGRQLVDIAAECEATSVKFQLIYPEGLYVPVLYENGEAKPWEVFDIRKKGALCDNDMSELAEYASQKSIPFSLSVFDRRGVDFLEKFNPPYIKIASTDLNNSALIKYAGEKGRKVVLSTGMSTLSEVEVAVKAFLSSGNKDLVLMHCVSVYPCPTGLTQMSFIDDLKQRFDCEVGFSDHTENSIAAIIAVTKGVTWIEKHFTYDRTAKGFDHAYAMEPSAFKLYIQDIRTAEQALKKGEAKVLTKENEVAKRARRGLYVTRPVEAGSVLTIDDVVALRPPNKYNPNDLPAVIGKRIKNKLCSFQAIDPDNLYD